jgi:hypothetical protein
MMRLAIAALAAALLLGGCAKTGSTPTAASVGAAVVGAVKTAATDVAAAEKTIANDLPTACQGLAGADALFKSAAAAAALAGKPFPGGVVTDEGAAMAGTVVPCATPAAMTSTPGALTTVLQSYAAVMQALATAKGSGA